jgi:hypothetical protein
MPDISMCADDECPARRKCYRHKASGTVPCEYRQAFADFQRHPEDERCSEFWPTEARRAVLDEMVKLQQEIGDD